MGSKQNIAYSLMLAMLQKKPKAKHFFDIFGGGASMSLMAKQFDLKVYYTEKNKGIVNPGLWEKKARIICLREALKNLPMRHIRICSAMMKDIYWLSEAGQRRGIRRHGQELHSQRAGLRQRRDLHHARQKAPSR